MQTFELIDEKRTGVTEVTPVLSPKFGILLLFYGHRRNNSVFFPVIGRQFSPSAR
jgi:hypothetical protein